MIGWYIQKPAIVQIHPSFAPMQFTTALCFFLVSLGIFIFPKYQQIASLSALLVLVISLLTFYGYYIAKPIFLDTFFVDPFVRTETAYPGRMAVNTSFAFLISSISLLFTIYHKSRLIELGGYIGLVVFGLGITALIAYALGIENVYKWGKLTGMALHTCSSFILLGLNLIFLNWKVIDERFQKAQIDHYIFGFTLTLQFIFFLIDIVIPQGVAMGVIQVLGIVLLTYTYRRDFLFFGFVLALVFTILGLIFSEEGSVLWMVYTDRALSIFVATVVYFLCREIINRAEYLRQQNDSLDRIVADRTKELQARNKDLEQFAYICTHDLQEPIRTISSYSQLVSETNRENLDELGKRGVDYIQASSSRMQNLIVGLLEYARLGKNLNLDFINTDKLVRNILIDLEVIIKEKNAQIIIEKLPEIECYKDEFQLLIQNLIINAFKYQQPNAQPIVEIGYKSETNRHLFFVKDNGIGIAKNFQSRIFKLFNRLHAQTEYTGTGIGLSQCKKITELHQGDIWVDSEEGKGSTFYFFISKQLKTHIDYDQENSVD